MKSKTVSVQGRRPPVLCDVIIGGGYCMGRPSPERKCRKKAVAIAGIYKQCAEHMMKGDKPL